MKRIMLHLEDPELHSFPAHVTDLDRFSFVGDCFVDRTIATIVDMLRGPQLRLGNYRMTVSAVEPEEKPQYVFDWRCTTIGGFAHYGSLKLCVEALEALFDGIPRRLFVNVEFVEPLVSHEFIVDPAKYLITCADSNETHRLRHSAGSFIYDRCAIHDACRVLVANYWRPDLARQNPDDLPDLILRNIPPLGDDSVSYQCRGTHLHFCRDEFSKYFGPTPPEVLYVATDVRPRLQPQPDPVS